MKLDERFWTKVNKNAPNGCWEWLAYRDQRGYGQYRLTRQRKSDLAHRLAWADKNGPIPDGMFCCHHCDNPSCLNPDHIFIGTQLDNVKDCREKGRFRNPPTYYGEDHPRAVVTEEDVRWIRGLAHIGAVRLGKLFGVSRQVIHHILKRNTWNHI